MNKQEFFRRKTRYIKTYRELHGEAPWECYFCGEAITTLGKSRESLNVHHLDHDFLNESPENLVAAHSYCHTKYHNSRRTPEQHRQAGVKRLKWWNSLTPEEQKVIRSKQVASWRKNLASMTVEERKALTKSAREANMRDRKGVPLKGRALEAARKNMREFHDRLPEIRRRCKTCGEEFTPTSVANWYCKRECAPSSSGKKRRELETQQLQLREYVQTNPGLTFDQLASRLNWSKSRVHRHVTAGVFDVRPQTAERVKARGQLRSTVYVLE